MELEVPDSESGLSFQLKPLIFEGLAIWNKDRGVSFGPVGKMEF